MTYLTAATLSVSLIIGLLLSLVTFSFIDRSVGIERHKEIIENLELINGQQDCSCQIIDKSCPLPDKEASL